MGHGDSQSVTGTGRAAIREGVPLSGMGGAAQHDGRVPPQLRKNGEGPERLVRTIRPTTFDYCRFLGRWSAP